MDVSSKNRHIFINKLFIFLSENTIHELNTNKNINNIENTKNKRKKL